MIETLSNVGREGNFLKLIKCNCIKPTATVILKGERQYFPPKWRTKQGCPLSPLLFNIILEILANATRKEKEQKAYKLEKK